MSAVAGSISRILWWYMLWFMRRPRIKVLQRAWLRWVRESKRRQAFEAFKAQNRWARRYGLLLITLCMNAFLASVLITVTWLAAVSLYESGAFTVPSRAQPTAESWPAS